MQEKITQLAHFFFNELKKYEKEGSDSMAWAEYAADDIDECIVKKFTIQDWIDIKNIYRNKSNSIKSLLVGHIHLNETEFAEIKLEILTSLVLQENIAIGYEALAQILFYFITSGTDNKINQSYHKKEWKGIFLSENATQLIDKFFTKPFIEKTKAIAEECGEFQKNSILLFLKQIKKN